MVALRINFAAAQTFHAINNQRVTVNGRVAANGVHHCGGRFKPVALLDAKPSAVDKPCRPRTVSRMRRKRGNEVRHRRCIHNLRIKKLNNSAVALQRIRFQSFHIHTHRKEECGLGPIAFNLTSSGNGIALTSMHEPMSCAWLFNDNSGIFQNAFRQIHICGTFELSLHDNFAVPIRERKRHQKA